MAILLTEAQLTNPGLLETITDYENISAYIKTVPDPDSRSFNALGDAMINAVKSIQETVGTSLRCNAENSNNQAPQGIVITSYSIHYTKLYEKAAMIPKK